MSEQNHWKSLRTSDSQPDMQSLEERACLLYSLTVDLQEHRSKPEVDSPLPERYEGFPEARGNLPEIQETPEIRFNPWSQEVPPQKDVATPPSVCSCLENPHGLEEVPGGPRSMGPQRVLDTTEAPEG